MAERDQAWARRIWSAMASTLDNDLNMNGAAYIYEVDAHTEFESYHSPCRCCRSQGHLDAVKIETWRSHRPRRSLSRGSESAQVDAVKIGLVEEVSRDLERRDS